MQKRAGLARAMALSPEVLLFDEPSAGLDPISSRLLDDLILELRDSLGATIVMVTHELPSIFAVGDNSVFLDAGDQDADRLGDPKTAARRMSGPESADDFCSGAKSPPQKRTRAEPGSESMSRRANPKIVGGFVLAAIGLAVAAALVFGSFTFFEVTRKVVVFFRGIRRRPHARFGRSIPRSSARPGHRRRESATILGPGASKFR